MAEVGQAGSRGLETSPSAAGAGRWAAFSSLAVPLSSWRELLIAAPRVHRRDRSVAHKRPGFLNLSSFFLESRRVWGAFTGSDNLFLTNKYSSSPL